jgi:hypothetical protein
MAKATPLIVSFNGGETSPKIDSRSDIQKYQSSCKTLENFVPLVEGGATRMPGTYFVIETKTSAKQSRLVPFHFSTTQAYVLEFGDLYIRFYKDEGQIVLDQSMSDFDPSGDYFVGEYVKVGKSVDISFAGSKHLYISAPYGRSNSGTIKIAASTNGADSLSVTAAGDTITIAVANGTGSKNAANLVQTAVRALGTVNGVSVADWYATENAAYAASRPITASLAATLCSGGESFHQCTAEIFSSASNTNKYPPAEATSWSVATLAGAIEITTPYLEADLKELKFTQSADVLYIFHPSYAPQTLTRTSHIQWELADLVCKKVDTAMTITGITAANPAVVTCSTVPTTLAAGDIVHISDVVGMTQVNNLYFTVGTVVTGAGGTFQLSGIDSSAYTAWASGGTVYECVYGTADNCPSCGTFFEQRLALAGSNNNPQTLYLSYSGDYDNFELGTPDDNAIEYTLVSDRVDRIFWLMGFEFLVVGTIGGVWKVGATTSGDPLTQTNITAKKQVAIGSKNIEPEVVSDVLLWVSGLGQSLQQFAFSLEKDKWVGLDMTRIAKHIAVGSTLALSGFTDMDYQKEPLPILWCIRADGQLIGLTYETQEDVYAWFRAVTDGSFESVAVISQENEEDQVWVTVNRTIDGSTKRYVEYFKPMNFYSEIKDAFFVHSGLTYDGGASATVTAITNASPCVVTLSASHGVTASKKLKFTGTGTWLDTHIVTAHSVNVNDITIYNESDAAAIDSTDATNFPTYVYPPVSTTTTYTGTPVNIVFAQQSNPCRVFALNHGIAASTPVRIADVGGMAGLNTNYTTVSVSQDSFTVSLDATAESAYTSGGTVTEGETTTTSAATVQIVQKAFTTGLDHLEGEDVAILVDGAVHPNETVTAGAITLDYYGNKIHIGLPYTSTLEPMKIHAGSQQGTSRGKRQKINRLTALFYETVGGKAGPDSDNLKSIPFGTGVQPELFTGDVDVEFNSGWDNEATVTIVQDQPLPMTVIGLVPHVSVNEA